MWDYDIWWEMEQLDAWVDSDVMQTVGYQWSAIHEDAFNEPEDLSVPYLSVWREL